MTVESFLTYLQRTANTGKDTEIPSVERLGAYHELGADEVFYILQRLCWADVIKTHEFDKGQFIIPGGVQIPSVEDLPTEPAKPMIPESNATIVSQRHAPEELRLSFSNAPTQPVDSKEFQGIIRDLKYTARSPWGHNKRGTSKSQKRK